MNRNLTAVLRGTGSSVPPRIVPNSEFVGLIDTSDEWIRTRTGILERRFAGPDEGSASLGIDASRKALASAHLKAKDLDLIICATVTPDQMTPANANVIQAGLGCRAIPAFDINAACTGFLYALQNANVNILAGSAKHVLVVGSEVLTRIVDMTDRNTCILFGDGAGAAVFSAEEGTNSGIRSIRLYSDGTNAHLITVPGLWTRASTTHDNSHDYLRMNGREVFRFAVCRMIELIEQAQADCRKDGLEIDLLIPHQVNRRIIDSALQTTGFPPEQVMVNLDKYGNTSAASVPIALDEAMREGRAKPGDTILLVAFGGGLTWGSAVVTL